MKSILPSHLISKAFASGGELAWKKEDIIEVIEEYSKLECAVEAVEAWIINEESKTWTGLFHITNSPIENIYVYDVKPKQKRENEKDFYKRANQEILNEISKRNLENEIMPELKNLIRYNLYVAKEYET